MAPDPHVRISVAGRHHDAPILGGSLTAQLGAALMATPAAEQIGRAVRLFDPVPYAASLLCIVTACACAG